MVITMQQLAERKCCPHCRARRVRARINIVGIGELLIAIACPGCGASWKVIG